MTDVTVVEKGEGGFAEENLLMTITDGYTYTTKLSKILGVHVTYTDEVAVSGGTAIISLPGYSTSGRTITFTTGHDSDLTSCSGGTAFVTIKGRL